MQTPDGLFAGRDGTGKPDLYYSAFGIKTLEILGHVWCTMCAARARAIADALFRRTADSITDLYSWLEIRRVLEPGDGTKKKPPAFEAAADWILDQHRTGAGLFSRTPGGEPSLQATFIGIMCERLLGRRRGGSSMEAVLEFIATCRSSSGGFSDVPGRADATAAATAAAVALLRDFDFSVDSGWLEQVRGGLQRLRTDRGGFVQYPGAPFADLLSTFLVLTACAETGGLRLPKAGAIAGFVRDCRTADGAFRSTPEAAESPDPEYTYYGLGSLALLGYELTASCSTPHEG